ATYVDDVFTRAADNPEFLPQELSQLPPPFRHPSPPPFHRHPPSNKSLYDLILSDPDTTILAKFISHDEHLTDLLNTTSANLTFFAPTDDAIRRIHRHYRHHHPPHNKEDNNNNNENKDHDHHHHRQPPKSFIRSILHYHTINGTYSPAEIFHTHTLPTTLTSAPLTPHHNHNPNPLPQRLSVRTTWKGLTLNLYARITSLDHRASNGNLYHIDSVLLPPPPSLRLLNLVPTEFSTFILALYKTGLDRWLNLTTNPPSSPSTSLHTDKDGSEVKNNGGLTLLIPSNSAFLSTFTYKTTAWLFNSPLGIKHLTALLKYHIIPSETVYSDTLYTQEGKIVEFGMRGFVSLSLRTLLSKSHHGHENLREGEGEGEGEGGEKEEVVIDVGRFGPYASLRVNGFQRVRVADLLAEEGNAHVLQRVLIPPRRVGGRIVKEGGGEDEGELGIEEVKGRL
ncbi:FAS1 domain-containing protein, partial [Aspergillus sclerotiicarbonarius CBS 121057]